MAGTGAGDVFRGVYEGSIPGSHMEVGRRPYHKNCSCALHGSRGARCPHHKTTKISYPIRRSWSEGSLALYAAASSSSSTSSTNPSPSSSPAAAAVDAAVRLTPRNHHLDICNEDDDDDLFPTTITKL